MSQSFFLGSYGKNGFFSCFSASSLCGDGEYSYILKGGPGTGKSGLMKKIAEKMEENDIDCEKFHCSSDPFSLDAVMIPSLRVNIFDGTAPHIMDPLYPGVTGEIVNPGECWNKKMLSESRNEIITAGNKNRELHEKSRKYIASAFSLFSDGEKICGSVIDKKRAERYASRIASKYFRRLSSRIGMEKIRLLDAITPQGHIFMNETVTEMCDERILFEDDFGTASSVIMEELKNYAAAGGYQVMISPFTGDGKTVRHLIIKELSLGFFTADRLCRPEIMPTKIVSLKRFYDREKYREYKPRLAFAKKSAGELMDEAFKTLKEAKTAHDELENYYIRAMDFEKLDEITENLRRRIWASEWYPESE